MKWLEKHWILTVVIIVAVLLYSAYGTSLISSSSASTSGSGD